MLFASSSFGDTFLWWLIILPFAFHGFRKLGKWFDDKGEVKEATKQGVLGMIGRWLK